MITPNEAEKLEKETFARGAWDLRVYVVGGGFQYMQMFMEAGLKGARSVEDADIICFTGGADVDPALYGEKALDCTHFDVARDEKEARIFGEAVALKKPMVGICRGGQFLNVMCGGKLWQDVNNHALGGTHYIVDMRTGQEREGMTSTHHQQMIPSDDAEILAVAERSTKKQSEHEYVKRDKPEADDMEVLWYKDYLCLCFQPHPEYHQGQCRNYFLELFDEYIVPAC